MKKQLTKWLINIATIASILWGHVCYADTPESKASQVYQQYRGKAGNRETLQQNFINPLVGGGTLRTIDNSKSGNVQLLCPSSKEFLTILIRPKGTGDFDADIYWDSNLDGRMDRSVTITNISGICTNGFISCTPGTWSNCVNYRFVYSDNNLTAQQTDLTSLSGCFCVNNSCGSNLLWNNIGYVLRLFGGAVVGAFQQADPRYIISESLLEGAAIHFYGQQTRDCQVASGGTGSLSPENLWDPPRKLDMAKDSLVETSSRDPQSFYNLVRSSSAYNDIPTQLKSCTIRRYVSSTTVEKYKPCSELGLSPPSGSQGGSQLCQYTGCQVTQSIENTCTTIQSDPYCKLYNETVDTVPTWREGLKTGLRPTYKSCVVTCGDVSCPECGRVYCYDWLSIRRDYVCYSGQIELGYAETRLGKIHQTLQYNNNEITFTDIRFQDNSWQIHTNQRFQVQAGSVDDGCEKACRVRVETAPQVSMTGPATSLSRSPGVVKYYYRACQDNICPTQAGEVVDIPCQCTNDFGAASTAMQALRLASQDIICTGGTIKALPGY